MHPEPRRLVAAPHHAVARAQVSGGIAHHDGFAPAAGKRDAEVQALGAGSTLLSPHPAARVAPDVNQNEILDRPAAHPRPERRRRSARLEPHRHVNMRGGHQLLQKALAVGRGDIGEVLVPTLAVDGTRS
jgi:hypothetical protein